VATLVSYNNRHTDLQGLQSILYDISSSLLSVSTVGWLMFGASATDLVSQNLLTNCQTAFWWGAALFRNFSEIQVFTSVVYCPSQNMFWIRMTCSSRDNIITSNWLHSTVHSTDNKWCFVLLTICWYCQWYITALPVLPGHKLLYNHNCTVTSQMHCTSAVTPTNFGNNCYIVCIYTLI
jgi:hypothetical protein